MRRDEGTVMLLTAGCVTVLLLVLVGLTQAATAFLAQRSLAGVCDGAAVAAAQGLDLRATYQGGPVRLAPAAARSHLARWMSSPGATTDAPGVVARLTVVDGDRAEVRCSRTFALPFGGPRVTLTAQASASLRPVDAQATIQP